jgi:hypothetical protein
MEWSKIIVQKHAHDLGLPWYYHGNPLKSPLTCHGPQNPAWQRHKPTLIYA